MISRNRLFRRTLNWVYRYLGLRVVTILMPILCFGGAPKGRPGAGLLAHILVSKYCDHLPLYRQSQILAREGIDIDRSTLEGWVGKSCALVERLSDKLRDHVFEGQALFADDTPIKLLAPGNGKTKTARLWIYIRYALTPIPKVRPYLTHGFLELDNNTAERAMRLIAIGRKNYLFLGSEAGDKSAAIACGLIETAKLNGVNPQGWLTYALANMQDTKISDLDKLMPWNYKSGQ